MWGFYSSPVPRVHWLLAGQCLAGSYVLPIGGLPIGSRPSLWREVGCHAREPLGIYAYTYTYGYLSSIVGTANWCNGHLAMFQSRYRCLFLYLALGALQRLLTNAIILPVIAISGGVYDWGKEIRSWRTRLIAMREVFVLNATQSDQL